MLRIASTAAALAMGLACALGLHAGSSIAQTAGKPPAMSGEYTNAMPIPVDDPAVGSIAGALIKPAGAGPFPVVVYLSGCAGLSNEPEQALEKKVIDHLLAKKIATFVVDPFTSRQEMGVCAKLAEHPELFARGAKDVRAVLNVLKSMPDIDQNRIFLQGYSYGAVAALLATDPNKPFSQGVKVAGVVAYYPFCRSDEAFGAPSLVLIGEKDDWALARHCEAIKDRPNVEVVVFPGITHAFVMPFKEPFDFLGHRFAYDENAAKAAQQRADAFIDARIR